MIAHVLALSELREELERSQREEMERTEEQAALELTELRRDLEEEKQVRSMLIPCFTQIAILVTFVIFNP